MKESCFDHNLIYKKYGRIRSAPGTNLVIAINLFVEPVDLRNLQDKLHKNIDNTISKDVSWTMLLYVVNAELQPKKRRFLCEHSYIGVNDTARIALQFLQLSESESYSLAKVSLLKSVSRTLDA